MLWGTRHDDKHLASTPCQEEAAEARAMFEGKQEILMCRSGREGEGKPRMAGKRRELPRAQSGVRGHRDQDRVEGASFRTRGIDASRQGTRLGTVFRGDFCETGWEFLH